MGNVEVASPHDIALGASGPSSANWTSAVERWLNEHVDLVVLVVVAAGFAIRLFVAVTTYLTPDEALEYGIVNQTSFIRAYRASLINVHPPLFYVLLYGWHLLGRAEWMLRLPSVLAGTALCWVGYKWIDAMFGKAAGGFGLILLAFSPAMIAFSVQARHYGLLLFFETAALYFIEIALREQSAGKLWCFFVFLYLAILTHYSALFFVVAVGVYSVARIADSHLPRRLVSTWALGQAGIVAIYGFLYLTQVSKVKQTIQGLATSWYYGYFHADSGEGLFVFTRNRTMEVFSFVFENDYTAHALLLLWIVAIAYLFVRDLASGRASHAKRHFGILLFLPFVSVWCAAIVGVYPYVGTRHTVFLFPFTVAALSFLLTAIYRQKLWAAILVAALIVLASNTSGKTFEPYMTKNNQNRALMTAAITRMRQSVRPGDVILVDFQSAVEIAYYLCGANAMIPVNSGEMPFKKNCQDYSVLALPMWRLPPRTFAREFAAVARANALKPGDKVWVFETGWRVDLGRQLPWIMPKFRCLASESFGQNISVMQFVVGPDLSPTSPVTNCPPAAFNSIVL